MSWKAAIRRNAFHSVDAMKKFSEKIDEYRALLATCTGTQCEIVFQQVADRYEDDLLELQEFESEYFNFVLDLLSESAFFSKPGVWNFLLVLGTEQHKLHGHHYEALSECIISHYAQYEEKDLCLAVCDFVARNYPPSKGKEIFKQLSKIEAGKTVPLRGFVADGLRILEAEERRLSIRH